MRLIKFAFLFMFFHGIVCLASSVDVIIIIMIVVVLSLRQTKRARSQIIIIVCQSPQCCHVSSMTFRHLFFILATVFVFFSFFVFLIGVGRSKCLTIESEVFTTCSPSSYLVILRLSKNSKHIRKL